MIIKVQHSTCLEGVQFESIGWDRALGRAPRIFWPKTCKNHLLFLGHATKHQSGWRPDLYESALNWFRNLKPVEIQTL